MPLVRRHGEIELHGADDARVDARDEDAAGSGTDAGQHLLTPEGASLVDRERDKEADAGTGVDRGVEHVTEHLHVVVARVRIARIWLPFLDADAGECGLRLAHGRTIAMT